MLFHLKSQSQAASIDLALLENEILANSNTGRQKFADGFFTADGTAGTGGRAKFAAGFVDTDLLGANAVTPAKADLTQTWDFSSGTLRASSSPVGANDVATKSYVESIAAGIRDWKDSVRVATTANLAATRTGNVLTATSNGAIGNIDGVAVELNDRVLVKDQSTPADNGLYFVSALGDGSNPYTLTRTTDADSSAEVTAGIALWVTEGTSNGDTGWLLTTNDPITLNTTSLTFVQFNSGGATTYVAGAGMTQSGSGTVTFDVVSANSAIVVNANDIALTLNATASGLEISSGLKVDAKDTSLAMDSQGLYVNLATNSGLEVSSGLKVDPGDASLELTANGLQVKRDSAGAIGLDGVNGIEVNVDATTIEISSNMLQLKDAGVSFAKLATAVSNRLGRYDRREEFTGSTSANIDLSFNDADQSTGGILVFKNGQLLLLTTDYTLSDNGGAGGVDRVVLVVSRTTSDQITVIYKRTGNAI